jgi:tRNA(Ile)-lysidine synthase
LPYYSLVREKLLQYIRERDLLRAGDRVAVAVSGGADSVALLRVLLELRSDLGIVLAVAHFNHGLRGEQSAADEAFVAELAKELELEFHAGHGDVGQHARISKLSVEAAGRQLRYQWLTSLAREQRLEAIATAHTLDDQAETVLLKLLRGAGTKGLAGIYPVVDVSSEAEAKAPPSRNNADGVVAAADIPNDSAAEPLSLGTLAPGLQRGSLQRSASSVRIIRPLLGISRDDIESYLTTLGQSWREDESNMDRRFLRNRVRHELLPLLEREFNPNVRQVLSDLAELSRSEEQYWSEWVTLELARRTGAELDGSSNAEVLDLVGEDKAQEGKLILDGFAKSPIALQRRLLKGFAEQQGLTLDFAHVESLRSCALGGHHRVELPGGRIAVNEGATLSLRIQARQRSAAYRYVLPVPGEVKVAELGLILRALVVRFEFVQEAQPGDLLSIELIGPELMVRNWAPGDRFWPSHSRSAKKLKRLFAEKRVPARERPSWPVAFNGEEIVWVRGFPVASEFRWTGKGEAVRIEVITG